MRPSQGPATVPGSHIGGRWQPTLDEMRKFERGTNLFPGLDAEVQKVYREHAGQNALRSFTYVLREEV